IVNWRYTEGMSIPDIAILAGCTKRTVYNILAWHRDYGVYSNPFARRNGRKHALEMADVTYLTSLLQANPALYLDELQSKLEEARGFEVSIATIYRTLKRSNLTRKQISSAAAERNDLLRATWKAAHGDISMDHIVWLDES
ncbi:hypothetical protein DFP72DRAFT_769852, partial [Ephemerocybe angulata]